MFVARDLLDNGLYLYQTLPTKRCLTYWQKPMQVLKLNSNLFPLLLWEDDPIRVELKEVS